MISLDRWRLGSSRLCLWGVLAAVVVAGCATTPPPEEPVRPPTPVIIPTPPVEPQPEPEPAPPPVPNPPPISEEAQQALSLLAECQRLSSLGPEEQKHEYASVNQLLARNKSDSLRIKLAVLLTLPAQQDDTKALALLEGVAGKTPTASPLKQLAALLATQLAERIRQIREEQKRAEQLQQKLDGLKAIEKSLLGRDRKTQGGH